MSSPKPISDREKQVLALMAQGKTGQEIAGRLGISARTVEAHTRSITKKLHAANKTHAVAIGFREGFD
jgi:DNA-binding CsgD family transcriptional regulator